MTARCGAPRDAGYASVLVLSLCVVLALLGAVAVTGGSVAVARHRAAATADAAALAAAGRALEGQVAACRAATEVSRAQGGQLLHCALRPDDVAEVLVAVRPHGAAARLGHSRARARAGPA